MIFRPQSKRVKEHKNLMASISKGDEVLTSGGILGKVTKIGEESDYVLLAINDNNQITIKKDYIAAVLPKGSIQSL
jgi:preprotein translocase subunit YajC